MLLNVPEHGHFDFEIPVGIHFTFVQLDEFFLLPQFLHSGQVTRDGGHDPLELHLQLFSVLGDLFSHLQRFGRHVCQLAEELLEISGSSFPVSIVFIVIFIFTINWETAWENGVVVKFLVAGPAVEVHPARNFGFFDGV
jgi:hypothetical protein